MKLSAQAFNKGFCLLSAVRRTSINDQEDLPFGAHHKALEELDESISIHTAFFEDHEPHVPALSDFWIVEGDIGIFRQID